MRKILRSLGVSSLVVLVILTGLRFATTDLRWPVLLASFSAYAFVGFVVAFLVCVVLLAGARVRGWAWVGAGTAILGLVIQALALAPLFTGGSDERPDLTVMTANLEFGGGDPVTVVRTAENAGVDVLVLEEVTPAALTRLRAVGLQKLLPHSRGEAAPFASGTIVFSRFRLGASRPLSLGHGGLDVQVRAPTPFRVLAVHTATPEAAPTPWLHDLETVHSRAEEAVKAGPTMVLGDFNATRDHEPFRGILGAGLRDAAEQAGSGWQPTWPTRHRKSWLRPLVTIDHVLVSRQFEAIRTRTVEVPNTDHLALVVELKSRM